MRFFCGSSEVPVTAPPKSNFRTMATCDLHLNRPLGPVLNDTTVIPPYPYCLGDSPRWHGPRDVVKRPVLGHGSTCQFGYLHNPEALEDQAQRHESVEFFAHCAYCFFSPVSPVFHLFRRLDEHIEKTENCRNLTTNQKYQKGAYYQILDPCMSVNRGRSLIDMLFSNVN